MHSEQLMACSHCTGPGTGMGEGTGPGAGCSVHIAVRPGAGPGAGNIMRACLHVLETALFHPRGVVYVVLRD